MAFIFQTAKSVLFELNSSKRVGDLLCNNLKLGSRVMIVTDNGIRNRKLDHACIEGLESRGFKVSVFSDVIADPPELNIHSAVHMAKSESVAAIVGLGGGSSMDVAKVVAFLSHRNCNQELKDMYGVGNCKGERLPLIQVPTTAGTGSEVTPIAIITTGENEKKGVVSDILLPDWAVLDGNLTLSLPPQISATTGIDAMVHAIESYTSKIKKNSLTDLLALEALRLLGKNIRIVCTDGNNTQARSEMLLGSMYGGMAIANAPVGAVHALAYPIGTRFHVSHGLSNSLMLPHVLRFNSEMSGLDYSPLAHAIFGHKVANSQSPFEVSRANAQFIQSLQELIADLQLPTKLRDVGIQSFDVEALAIDAMKQTRLLPNNPREVTLHDAVELYSQAL